MINRLKRLVPSDANKTRVLLVVMCINFGFVGVDVVMAHSQSHFFRWTVIPIGYSALAVLAILSRVVFHSSVGAKRAFQAMMWLGVLVGVMGTFFHLHGNATSSPVSLHRLLIEGSPVAAPIAFAGIASYALVSEHYRGRARDSRLLTLVGLGFFGAMAAAFLDHARLGFVPSYTLIPIASGALAALSCLYIAYSNATAAETRVLLYILGINALIGLVGFGFHVLGDLAGTESIVWARFLYRNPILGPLLFCNLALLAGLCVLPGTKVALTSTMSPNDTTRNASASAGHRQ